MKRFFKSLPTALAVIALGLSFECRGEETAEDFFIPDGKTEISEGDIPADRKIGTLHIPTSVTAINRKAFYNTSIRRTTVPAEVMEISPGAFYESVIDTLVFAQSDIAFTLTGESYEKIMISGATIGHLEMLRPYPDAFDYAKCSIESIRTRGRYSRYDHSEQIPSDCFYKSEIRNVTLLEGVSSLGKRAFKYCKKLEELNLPSTLRTIEADALDSTGLKELVLPEGIESITEIFASGSKFEKVVIPSTLTKIHDSAFYEHPLREIIFSDGPQPFNCSLSLYGEKCIKLHLGRPMDSGFGISTALERDPANGEVEITFGPDFNKIPQYLFSQCGALRNITIPSRIESIGTNAFSGCSNLTRLVIEDSSEPLVEESGSCGLESCEYLQDLYIGRNTSTITFPILGAAPKVEFGQYVTELPDRFYRDTEMEKPVLPNGMTYLSAEAFAGASIKEIDIPDEITEIGSGAFRNCKKLAKVKLSAELTHLDSLVFEGCTSLKEISLPANLLVVGSSAFKDCSSLGKLVIPANVMQVREKAFYGCSELSEVVFEDSETPLDLSQERVKGEGYGFTYISPFKDSKIQSVYLGRNITNGERKPIDLFAGQPVQKFSFGDNFTYISEGTFRNCSTLTGDLVITERITVGAYAFEGTGISSVKLPDTHQEIWDGCFKNCKALKSVDFGTRVSHIWHEAFRGSGLETLTLPSNIQWIGLNVFSECTLLKEISIEAGSDNMVFNVSYDDKEYPKKEYGQFFDCPVETFRLDRNLLDFRKGLAPLSGVKTTVDVQFGPNVTKIPAYFFYGFTARSYPIPEGISEIGEHAYAGATMEKLIIPGSVTKIKPFAFHDCKNIKHVVIEESYSGLEFWNTDSINFGRTYPYELSETPFVLPMHLDKLEVYRRVSSACKATTELRLNDKTPGEIAYKNNVSFYGYYFPVSLAAEADEVIIGGSETSIPDYFLINSQIRNLNFDETVKYIGNAAFAHCDKGSSYTYYVDIKRRDTGIESIVWPRELEKTGWSAFANNISTLESSEAFQLPPGLQSVNEQAFAGCNFGKLEIPEGVEGLDRRSFYDSYITELTLPSTLTDIENDCFIQCDDLKSVTCNALTPPSMRSMPFPSTTVTESNGANWAVDIDLYVPEEALELYSAPYIDYRYVNGWSRFRSINSKDASVNSVIDDLPDPIYYRLDGTQAGNDRSVLKAGIYIERRGTSAKKILIR